MSKIQTVRGMKDRLPGDQAVYDYILKQFRRKTELFGFGWIDTPIVEQADLFIRSLGQATDVIDKEMFEVVRPKKNDSVENSSDDVRLVLRPEGTAGVVRSYIESGMQALPQPVMLAYAGKMFRYDRPQKGRYREFNQIGIEIIGDSHPIQDAFAIMVAWQTLKNLKVNKLVSLEINTIGDRSCRVKIKKSIVDYFKPYKTHLCDDCQSRLSTNPLRVLDCKNLKCQEIINGAPQIFDLVCDDCQKHFKQVLEYLDELEIAYELSPRLVRGLDYYSRTTFEFKVIGDDKRQSVIGGGGRYDGLVQQLGGKDTPAVGWSIGVERLIDLMIDNKVPYPPAPLSQVVAIQIGERARKLMLKVLTMLMRKGIKVDASLSKDTLKTQLKSADKAGVEWVLIIGQKEAYDNSVILRNLEDRSQETVPLKKLEEVLQKRIKK